MSARILYGRWVCSNALLTVVSLWRIIGDAASNIQTGALRSIGCNAAYTCIAKPENPSIDQRQHAIRRHGSWSGAAWFSQFQRAPRSPSGSGLF
jgi:hypothetical protein